MEKIKWQLGRSLLLILVFPALVIGCKDSDNEVIAYDPSKPIVVDSFYPTNGGVGTKLIIRGSNFGSDASLVKVVIQNEEMKEAKIVNVCDTRIYAVVPSRAGTGNISITIGREEQAQSIVAEGEFSYQYRENVSTLCGGGSMAEIKDGPFRETRFIYPIWLLLDENKETGENKLYVLDGYPEARQINLRVLDLDQSTTNTAMVGTNKVCTMSFSPERDTIMFGIQGNPSTSYLTREKGFSMQKTYFALDDRSNAGIMHPIDRELFVNCWDNGAVRRVDRTGTKFYADEKIVVKPFSDFVFCWSPDGKTLFNIVRESGGGGGGVIVKVPYDSATKTFGESSIWVGSEGQLGWADGVGPDARFRNPNQMVPDPSGDGYYIADIGTHCIRKITEEGSVTTIAGQPDRPGFTEGDPRTVQFNHPRGLAISNDGTTMYVADTENKRICKIVIE